MIAGALSNPKFRIRHTSGADPVSSVANARRFAVPRSVRRRDLDRHIRHDPAIVRPAGARRKQMPRNVAVGLGLMEFPFTGAAAYWRWVDMLEAGGVDSLWQT